MQINRHTGKSLINAIGFQALWFLCVLGQDSLILIPLGILITHITLSTNRKQELLMIGTTLLAGSICDSLLTYWGVFNFAKDNLMLGIIPLWLVILWAGFGATLKHSLNYLFKHQHLFPLFCAAIAPLSYIAGERLGAVSLPLPTLQSYAILAAAWGVVALILQWFDRHLPVLND